MANAIRSLTLSHVVLPLETPVSDAKVLTGRQKSLTETVLLFVEVTTEQGHRGMGFSYSKRAGGPAQYAHLREVTEVIGQDPADIDRIYQSLMWAGACGVATQAVAALDVALWDLKARRADLPLAKLLGAYRDSCRVYNTSGGFLQACVEEIEEKASASLEAGIGGITSFLRFATLASHAGLALAPHYAMEIHLHLAAAYPTEPWVEHFEWLNPLFEERIEIRDGQMWVPDRPGLGFTLSERMRQLTKDTVTIGAA